MFRELLKRILLTLFLFLILNGCSENDPASSSAKTIPEGEWTWEYSAGGLFYHFQTPATRGFSQQMVFSAGNTVSIYRADTLYISSRYETRGDTLFIEKSDMVQLYKIEDDQLELSDLCMDCFVNYYRRSDKSPRIIMYNDPDDHLLPDDPFQIDDVKITGDKLSVFVKYSGGCTQHYFSLFGSNAFMESYPVQAALKLTHNDKDDACDAIISDTLYFNLTPLKESYIKSYGSPGSMYLQIKASADTGYFKPMPLYEF